MCILTYFPPNTIPDVDALARGAYWNRDGHGFAIVTDTKIMVRRSMDSGWLIDRFADARAKHPDGPALFHSRFATHGTVGVGNCHPFKVGHDRRTVVAHNGILPAAAHPGKKDRRSDTRLFADDLLPTGAYGSLDTGAGRARLAAWLGRSNKLAVLTVNPRYRARSYLINEQQGLWDEGIWYSNSDYQPWEPHWAEDDTYGGGLYPCPNCGADEDLYSELGMCAVCGACGDCGELAEGCQCYLPGYLAARELWQRWETRDGARLPVTVEDER